METRNNKYGYIPDLPDFRDYQYSHVHKVSILFPDKVILRSKCSPVEDQGALGSCTANALVGAMEYLMAKDGKKFNDMSRLFLYYNERVIENSVRTDSGAMIRDGIKTMAKNGVCTETMWPYNIDKFTRKPPKACYSEALNYQITSYARLSSILDMQACLATGFPFVFGFSVYESFESEAVAKTGVVNMPKPKERLLGGHAVLAVGYDNLSRCFIVRNSWGKEWGIEGYFTIPFDYLNSRDLSDDFWTIRAGENI